MGEDLASSSSPNDDFLIKVNNTVEEEDDIECNLVFHGAAASSSCHSVVYLKGTDTLVYPSHSIVNLATKTSTTTSTTSSSRSVPVMRNVHQTLRTNIASSGTSSSTVIDGISSNNVITCLTQVQDYHAAPSSSFSANDRLASANDIACGFSNGSLNLWWWLRDTNTYEEELIGSITSTSTTAICPTYSVTDIAAMKHIPIRTSTSSLLLVVTASCAGVTLYSRYSNCIPTNNMLDDTRHHEEWTIQKPTSLTGCTTSSVATVLLQRHESLLLLFTGSAIPRANRIRIFTLEPIHELIEQETTSPTRTVCKPLWDVTYQGHLLGHQDWITCMDWTTMKPNNSIISSSTVVSHNSYLLASGSQDAKIRLWKFIHTTNNINDSTTLTNINDNIEEFAAEVVKDDDDDDYSSVETQETLVEDEEARLVLQHRPSSNGKTAVTLEAILVGHEDIVTSVSWQPNNNTNDILLSSSMDRSILLWSLEEDKDNIDYSKDSNNNNITKSTSSCWIPHARIGVAGGILGASIGSSLLGFVDALWVDDTTIVGHGYGGTLYFWSCNTNTIVPQEEEQQHQQNNYPKHQQQQQQQQWKAQPPLTGHFRPVNDLSWEPTNGEFLLTVSSDQTCRLIAPIPKASTPSTNTGAGGDFVCGSSSTSNCFYWREVGRPQVHGYDIHAVSCIGGIGEEPYGRLISGSSEKQLRAFDAPCATLRLLDRITNPWHTREYHETELLSSRLQGRPEKSFLPSLGLTNKAVEHDGDTRKEEGYDTTNANEEDFDTSLNEGNKASDPDSTSTIEDILPRERELGTSTLWPEVTQLFGHPTEVICVASTSRCKFNDVGGDTGDKSMVIVASSCKARNSEQASIRLWNVSRGSCLGTLKDGHQSTVVTLGFSVDARYLASSGKDRRICLWKRNDKKDTLYLLSAVKSMAHKRIIWSLHWCPHDPAIFATGSRDGLVKVWMVFENAIQSEIIQIHAFEPVAAARKKHQNLEGKPSVEAVTAVSFSPVVCSGISSILAVGLESGRIELWSVSFNGCGDRKVCYCSILHVVNESHLGAVKKIEWRPKVSEINVINESSHEKNLCISFATCSLDHGIRIFDLIIKK